MTLRPASRLWLLRHELRLSWRHAGAPRSGLLLVLGAVLWLAFHLAAYALLRFAAPATLAASTALLLGATGWFVFVVMLSHAITLSVDVLFDRGDLDLLLASPLPPGNVFLVRGLGVAVACAALYAALLLPFAHVGPFAGRAELLAIYPALAALALLATACAMALTLALVRVLGARRARTAAQLLGALVGAAFFLVLQAGNLFGDERVARWLAALGGAGADGNPLGPAGLIRLPFDAMLGRPLPLAMLAAAGVGSFALVIGLAGRRFLAGTQESTSDAAQAENEPRAARPFRSGLWRVVLLKEWKLIVRDPQVIAQTLLQTLYLVPLLFVWSRHGALNEVLVPAAVLAATTLASGIAWITIAAEDAPELLATAPVDPARLRRIKLVAALLPVWATVAPLLVYLVVTDGPVALVFAACIAGATISAGLIHMNVSKPGDRRQMRRRGRGSWLGGGLELATALGWSALAWCLLAAPRLAPVAAAVALAAPLLAAQIGRARRRESPAA